MKIETETNQDLRFELRRMGVRFTISLTGLRDWWGGGAFGWNGSSWNLGSEEWGKGVLGVTGSMTRNEEIRSGTSGCLTSI